MQPRSNTRASLFFLELIIAILFFALGSAVCAQAFARAYTVSRQAKELAFASATVSSAAAALEYTDGSLEAFRAWFPEAYEQDGALEAAYDASLAPCGREMGHYTLHAAASQAAGVRSAEICMFDNSGETLYALSLRWPSGQRGGAP